MIILELLKEDSVALKDEIDKLPKEDVQMVSSMKFQGESEMVQLLVELTSVTIPSVAAIIVTLLKARKHVEIKYEGNVIKGVSEKNALKALEELRKEERERDSSLKTKGKKR